MTDIRADEIRTALRAVIDPELGYNIVDLGFIYDIVVVGRAACITMTTTVPGCPAARFLKEGVVSSAARVPGIASVDVVMTFEPRWTPARIDPAIRRELGFAAVN